MDYKELVKAASEARNASYSPYSNFAVGAALLGASGKVYKGCNVENAAYPATNCAERTAFFAAVAEGERVFRAIAIIGGAKGESPTEYCYPCGICRQVMGEFCNAEFQIIVALSEDDYKVFTLEEMLPHGFVLS